MDVPVSIEASLDPAFLTEALAAVSGGAQVISVEQTSVLTTAASKVRFKLRFANAPEREHHFCLKAFMGEEQGAGGLTTIREADFFTEIAPRITMRTPHVAATVLDRVKLRGMLLMDDMIVAGAHFCSALEPFTTDLAARTLDQIARLHAASALLAEFGWIPDRLAQLADHPILAPDIVQTLLDDQRGAPLARKTRSSAVLHDGLKALAARNRGRRQTMLHGDCHAGNVYLTEDGPGFTDWQLIQRGGWAVDVAYHICAVLPVEVAEREERALVDHYIAALARHGGARLEREAAWEDYRAAQVYGFYQWAITRFQPRDVIDSFAARLGAGVERHRSYELLGV